MTIERLTYCITNEYSDTHIVYGGPKFSLMDCAGWTKQYNMLTWSILFKECAVSADNQQSSDV